MTTQPPERKKLQELLTVFITDPENRRHAMALADAYADGHAARMVEAHARPNPLQTRPRGFGGKDLSESKRRQA